jgi:hypothetical protein
MNEDGKGGKDGNISNAKDGKDGNANGDGNAVDAENIIEVVFRQESHKQSYIDVQVNDASSFASTDTFLDLSSIAMANFSTFLELLSAPSSSTELEIYRGNLPSDVLSMSPSTLSRNTSISSGISDKDGTNNGNNGNTNSSNSSNTGARSDDDWSNEGTNPGEMFRDSLPDLGQLDITHMDGDARASGYTSPADDTAVSGYPPGYDRTSSVGRKEPLYQVENSMIVKVVLKDPRLHLLDDPTLESTSAIVGRCGVEIHYTRDQALSGYSVEGSMGGMFELQRKMVRESLHVSVKSLEIFTLADLQQYVPHAIIEPFGVEVNMRREVVDRELVCSSLSVDTDAVKARVTMNDLLLANSVIFRSSTTDNTASEGKKSSHE